MRWVLLIVLAASVAEAGPIVEIQAHTQVSITAVNQRENGMVEVRGRLTDKLTGDGIANERVYVTLGGQKASHFTFQDGSFAIELPAPPGPVDVTLEYRGGSRLEKADAVTMHTDPAKTPVRIEIVKTQEDPTGARIRTDAVGESEGNLSVPVELAVAPVGTEVWKTLRVVTSGTEAVLTRTEAGGPGTHRLRALFTGDETHQPGSQIVSIELTSGTTTSMSLSSKSLAYEDELVVTGRVIDDDGKPVAQAAVTLKSGDRRLAQGATNDDGRYRFEVEAEIIGQGDAIGIQVDTDPGTSFIRPSHADPVVIKIAPPQPVPVSWTVAAFVATVLAAGGFFAARTKPWRRLRRPAPPADVPSEEGEIEQVKGGLVVAKPGVVATLRRPNDEGFAGVVRDTVRGRPIAEAVVSVVLGSEERETRTAADGSFAIENLGPGDWRAEVAAPGHVTERFAVSIPHRGELRGVRVDLVPVRERVFQLYRRAAEPVLPEARLWGIWSPRQIVDHVRSRRPSPALADLTDFVEEVYFSPRVAAESLLGEAGARVDRAIGERARPPAR
ncbi:MAG: carboxypeptidase regulatory-like domain-containing protein [Kofleriaceae bacterium]|nr:carboxypeptidase regulatory-like domain-containing protein [Kofleriaceae bacterium]